VSFLENKKINARTSRRDRLSSQHQVKHPIQEQKKYDIVKHHPQLDNLASAS
jgi:hypothetical protein